MVIKINTMEIELFKELELEQLTGELEFSVQHDLYWGNGTIEVTWENVNTEESDLNLKANYDLLRINIIDYQFTCDDGNVNLSAELNNELIYELENKCRQLI